MNTKHVVLSLMAWAAVTNNAQDLNIKLTNAVPRHTFEVKEAALDFSGSTTNTIELRPGSSIEVNISSDKGPYSLTIKYKSQIYQWLNLENISDGSEFLLIPWFNKIALGYKPAVGPAIFIGAASATTMTPA